MVSKEVMWWYSFGIWPGHEDPRWICWHAWLLVGVIGRVGVHERQLTERQAQIFWRGGQTYYMVVLGFKSETSDNGDGHRVTFYSTFLEPLNTLCVISLPVSTVKAHPSLRGRDRHHLTKEGASKNSQLCLKTTAPTKRGKSNGYLIRLCES